MAKIPTRRRRAATSAIPDDALAVITATAVLRGAIGVAAVVAPGLSARLLLSDPAAASASRVPVRMFGVREVVFTLGVLAAIPRGAGAVGQWVTAGALADVGDAVTMVMDRGRTIRRPVRILSSGSALGAAAGAAGVMRALRAHDA